MNTQIQHHAPSPDVAEGRPRWASTLTAAWWLVGLATAAFFGVALLTMGDPGTTFTVTACFAFAAAVCSVAAFVVTRRWYALIPLAMVAAVVAVFGVLAWAPTQSPDPGIDPRVAALSVSFDSSDTPECLLVPSYQVIAAGDHVLMVSAQAGTTVTITGPAPSTAVVASYVRPDESDGVGPTVHLDAGSYTLTCTGERGSSSTELNVGP